jgi:hypothetical protein
VRPELSLLRRGLAGLCLFLTASLQAQSPAVLVEFNGQQQGYFQQPRLAEVLLTASSDSRVYWPTAQLYKLDPSQLVAAEQLRGAVMEQLRLLSIHWQAEPLVAANLMQLRSQLVNWRLAQPLFIALDPDLSRIRAEFNPKLDAGMYLLQTKRRPGFITLTGLGGDQFVEHKAGTLAYQYLAQAHGIDHSGVDDMYWLHIGPTPVKLPVASWNRNLQQLPPGSLLFVPVPAKWLPEPWQDLNQQLLQLLQSRVYK